MYGPTKGDMQFLVTLAVIGLAAIIACGAIGGAWLFGVLVRTFQ